MTKIYKSFFLIAAFLTLPNIALATISFTDGKWETGFEYGVECVKHWQFYDNIGYCQDVSNDGVYWLEWPPSYNTYDSEMKLTMVESEAAFTGSFGFRAWIFDGDDIFTPTVKVVFPAPQKDLWIRWYYRYQCGFAWDPLGYEKNLYIHDGGGNSVITGIYQNHEFYAHSTGNTQTGNTGNIFDYTRSHTWEDQMGGSYSNGEWFPVEFHIKMDDGLPNGTIQMWIDGNLIIDRRDVLNSGNNALSKEGWTDFNFESNQYSPGNLNGPLGVDGAYMDYDNLVIYNQAPPNSDLDGNPFIGPIGWTNSTDIIAPNAPSGLSVF